MAFDESVIADVEVVPDGPDVHLSWSTSAPGPFQVYVDRRLAWSGPSAFCTIPRPTGEAWVHVGAVAADEIDDDLSATLAAPAGGGDRARLDWTAGTYLAADLAAFRVYGSLVPGGAISYAAPLATVAAYPGGVTSDGFGLGGFGEGGFGQSANDYSWTSGRLRAGTWLFEARPVDAVGNERSGGPTASVTIVGPPGPPARDAAGDRLTYTYDAGTGVVILAWLASPG